MSNPILLAPGPVQLHPEVQKILAQPMIHHRTPAFDSVLAHAFQKLKFLFQTDQPVFIHTATGSGAMESCLVNVLSPGDSILAIVSGKFGERWADMAEAFGARVHRLNIPWGQSVKPADVAVYLQANPQTKIVMSQACETSTGTVHDIRALGEIIAKTPALFLVDGITAVGAFPLPMDAWQIDGLIAGSQKGIMLPTGLSFVSYSKKAWSLVEKAQCARYYFDLRKERKANLNGETLFSSNVPLIKSLDFILTEIQTLGLEKHFAIINRRAKFTRHIAQSMGFTLFSANPSDSVTALSLPEKIKDGVKFRSSLEEKYAVTVMGGQDQAKGKIIRLGHMGFISDLDLVQSMTRLAHALNDFEISIDPTALQATSEKWLKENSL